MNTSGIIQAVAKWKFNNKSWAPVSGHRLCPLVWSFIKGTTLENLAPKVPTLKYSRLKFGSFDESHCSHTPRCKHNFTPQKSRVRIMSFSVRIINSSVRIMHIIHSMHTLAYIYCEILILYGERFLRQIIKYWKVVKVWMS